jgi:hypothetical protein
MPLTDEQITEAALRPKRTTTDEGTVEEHSLKDLLAVKNQTAAPETPPWGLRIARTQPRGTV